MQGGRRRTSAHGPIPFRDDKRYIDAMLAEQFRLLPASKRAQVTQRDAVAGFISLADSSCAGSGSAFSWLCSAPWIGIPRRSSNTASRSVTVSEAVDHPGFDHNVGRSTSHEAC